MKFPELIIIDKSDDHTNGRGQNSKSRSQKSKPILAIFGPLLEFEFTYGGELM